MTKVQPHSSNGVVRAYTLNYDRVEYFATLDKNREDVTGQTAILGLLNGEKKIIKWEEITFMRDLANGEVAK